MALTVKILPFEGFCANSYLVTDTETDESFLVDPGVYGTRFSKYVSSQGVTNLKYILLTHGHYDHIVGVQGYKNDFGGEVVIHAEDEDCLSDDVKSLFAFKGLASYLHTKADITVKDGDTLPFGKDEIEVIHTPGHTKGSVCYKTGNMLFTGDTLFKGTVGRTDFPGGSYIEMLESMKKLHSLSDNLKVYPGHEELTNLLTEKTTNPYMRGI